MLAYHMTCLKLCYLRVSERRGWKKAQAAPILGAVAATRSSSVGRSVGRNLSDHSTYDWKMKKTIEQARGTKCFNCGGRGHLAKDCRVKVK